MKRFWPAIFFLFIFCLGVAGTASAGDPHSVYVSIYKGPFAAVPEGELDIQLTIRDEGLMPLYGISYEWELFKSEESTGKIGNGKTNFEGYSCDVIIFENIEDNANYRLDVWVGNEIASLPFSIQSGKGMSVGDDLVVTDRKSSGGDSSGGGGCSTGLGVGIFALAGLALLKRKTKD